MRSKKFSHFEIFKIVVTTIYITSGSLMFGTLITNASEYFNETKSQKCETKGVVDCMNCDEID
jgi:hypothetical protein